VARPLDLRRGVVLVGVVGGALLLASPWATRRALREAIVEEVVVLSSNDFSRPAHRGEGGSGTVIECLDAVFAGVDAGVQRPALPLARPFTPAVLDGGRAWLEQTRGEVTLARRCLEAPAVGPFDAFGERCGATAHLSRSRVLLGVLVWLRAEASSLVPDAAPLDACLDVTALERDAPAVDGFVGAAFAGTSARLTIEPCVRALTFASPAERERARRSLERITSGLVPFSSVLRLERGIIGVSGIGGVLHVDASPRLPESARACVGSSGLSVDAKTRLGLWLMAPTAWDRLRRLEELSRLDPRLESPAAVAATSTQWWWAERFFFDDDVNPAGWARSARRYDTLSRKTATLLAVIAALEEKPVSTPAWMKLGVTPTTLHLEVELDEGWMTVDVER
jgi:hypothetical protein